MRTEPHLDLDMAEDPQLAAGVADTDARMELVGALERLRKEAGLTQTQVAVRMETTQSFVSDFETGRTDPYLSTFQRYARAIGAELRLSLTSAADSEGRSR